MAITGYLLYHGDKGYVGYFLCLFWCFHLNKKRSENFHPSVSFIWSNLEFSSPESCAPRLRGLRDIISSWLAFPYIFSITWSSFCVVDSERDLVTVKYVLSCNRKHNSFRLEAMKCLFLGGGGYLQCEWFCTCVQYCMYVFCCANHTV